MSALSALAPQRLLALFRADAISVAREPVLFVNLFIGLILPILLAAFGDQIDAYAGQSLGITGFSAYAVPFALITPAILIGWVTGMLLLEDRDDGPLLALEVTAIGKGGFLLYRTFVLMLIASAATLFTLTLLLPDQPGLYFPLVLLISLESVFISFALVALAGNKVEGMALSKILNMLALVPLLALLATPWRYAAGIIPSFWIGEILLRADGHLSGLTFLIALVVHIASLVFLFRLVTRRLG
ncbi:hypothetical protein [Parvularcula sp. IMCC14364]|uniref:hypothetical protein n=1 Tax=Parvularcula sp. IMCC14364 TaxID=3067902 RepID=UPI0027429107|nr:hypothetical protein [Parvularcula sp. IMCC14364]